MSTRVGIILHIISTLIMFTSFCFMLGAMLTNSWRGTEVRVNGTDVYQGLTKYCVQLHDHETCTDMATHDASEKDGERRKITRALLTAAIFFSFLSFGVSVIALCKRTRTIHIRYQLCVILTIIIGCGCGLAALVLYTNYFSGQTYKADVKYSWRYSWKLGWAGSIILIISFLIAIYDTCTFPKDDYESA